MDGLILLRTYGFPDLLAAASTLPPLGPGFAPAMIAAADRLEVWGTPIAAPTDLTEWRLMRGAHPVAIRRIQGY